jgi:ribosomal protein S18 acetylase RimI-like enzyme
MKSSDLPQVNHIADQIHLSLPERPEVFTDKYQTFPEGAFVLENGGDIVGYGLSHPWVIGDIPPLDEFLGLPQSAPNCLYLHDVAILDEARGRGFARELITMMVTIGIAHRLHALALVSVYGTNMLWRRYGFNEMEDAKLVNKLSTYGESAHYMVKRV